MEGTFGSNSKLQIGKETLWGTNAATMTHNINFSSESFKMDAEFDTDDSVIGGITKGVSDVVAYKTIGGFECQITPENAQMLFALALGDEQTPIKVTGSTGAYEHEIIPVDGDTDLPSFTSTVYRKLHTKAYNGCMIKSWELAIKAKEAARFSCEVIAKSASNGSINASLTNPILKKYLAGRATMSIDGVSFADVEDLTVSVDNGVSDSVFTLGSGLYTSMPSHGEREIKIKMSSRFTSAINQLIEQKYLTGTPIAVVINLESPSLIETGHNHALKIEIPNLQLTGGLPNVSGKDEIKVSLEGDACEFNGVSPISVTVINDESEVM